MANETAITEINTAEFSYHIWYTELQPVNTTIDNAGYAGRDNLSIDNLSNRGHNIPLNILDIFTKLIKYINRVRELLCRTDAVVYTILSQCHKIRRITI